MKKILFGLIIIFFGFCLSIRAFGQDSLRSNPLEPVTMLKIFKIGIYSGINNTLGPSIMKNAPKFGTPAVQKSLLNGLDGLGFANSVNFGIFGNYPISSKISLGANLEYSQWKSDNSCNCQDTGGGLSHNSLFLYHLALFAQYKFLYGFYIAPEINLNTFAVQVQENNSKRGTLDFSKNYFRIGSGLALGYDYKLAQFIGLDANFKIQALNILLGKDFNPDDSESQALINSVNSTKESVILLFSFNLGFLLYF